MTTRPEVGVIRPAMTLNRVLLPQPDDDGFFTGTNVLVECRAQRLGKLVGLFARAWPGCDRAKALTLPQYERRKEDGVQGQRCGEARLQPSRRPCGNRQPSDNRLN